MSEYDIITNTQPYAEDLGIVGPAKQDVKKVRFKWVGDGNLVESFRFETFGFLQNDRPKNSVSIDVEWDGLGDE